MADDIVVQAWVSLLPCRIYLDTSTLQKLYDFGGEIFENEPFEPVGRAARVQGLGDEIEALRMIFAVNERAMFEFVVAEASLREVIAQDKPGFTQWVYDVLDTWLRLLRRPLLAPLRVTPACALVLAPHQ